MSEVSKLLGTEDEQAQCAIIRRLATPPLVITILVSPAGLSISGVGNSSYREVQNILLEAIRSLTLQEAQITPNS
jgi:hypothetical protein